MKKLLFLSLILFSEMANSQETKLPVIDMHMHSSDTLWGDVSPCYPPDDCQGIKTEAKNAQHF